MIQDHLRAYGEQGDVEFAEGDGEGSSPRMRRTVGDSVEYDITCRIISAHAENSDVRCRHPPAV